jgi:hypothetical protein
VIKTNVLRRGYRTLHKEPRSSDAYLARVCKHRHGLRSEPRAQDWQRSRRGGGKRSQTTIAARGAVRAEDEHALSRSNSSFSAGQNKGHFMARRAKNSDSVFRRTRLHRTAQDVDSVARTCPPQRSDAATSAIDPNRISGRRSMPRSSGQGRSRGSTDGIRRLVVFADAEGVSGGHRGIRMGWAIIGSPQ